MKGLIIKDLYIIESEIKKFILLLVIFLVFSNDAILVSVIFGSLASTTVFSYDEQARWYDMEKMLPISNKKIVMSRYIVAYISIFATVIIANFLQIFKSVFITTGESIPFNILTWTLIFSLTYVAINTPILFKVGVEKGRYFLIVLMFASFGIFNLFEEVFLENFSNIQSIHTGLGIIFVVIINAISIYISLNIKNEKSN